MKLKLFLLLSIFSTSFLQADWLKWRDGHQLSFGPELFYMTRKVGSGTEMEGWFQGWRGSYDHIAENSLYWGVELGMATGGLSGHQSNGDNLRLDTTEWEGEARLGFTLHKKNWKDLLFVPFVGYHYFQSNSSYFWPTWHNAESNDRCHAVIAGILATIRAGDRVRLGLDIRTRYMFDGLNEMQNCPGSSPQFERVMGSRFHYVVQLPVDIDVCGSDKVFLRLKPFFRTRNYGAWENSPKNFHRTVHHLYGVAVEVLYQPS